MQLHHIWCQKPKNLSLADCETASLPKNVSLGPEPVRARPLQTAHLLTSRCSHFLFLCEHCSHFCEQRCSHALLTLFAYSLLEIRCSHVLLTFLRGTVPLTPCPNNSQLNFWRVAALEAALQHIQRLAGICWSSRRARLWETT